MAKASLAINQVLRWLGVVTPLGQDEFAAVGLTRLLREVAE